MRIKTGGVAHISSCIEEDMRGRKTGLQEPHIKGLSDVSASVLTCRSVNTSEIANVLPRLSENKESRYRYLNRLLQNERIIPLEVMGGFVPEVLANASSGGKAVVLIMDQSKVGTGQECLMMSLRVGGRALPLGWIVRKTEGNIGWADQACLLNSVAAMVPAGTKILLAADRFYGTSAMVAWCQKAGWSYRIRLKGNLIFQHQGGDITGNDAVKQKLSSLKAATFNDTDITTNIGIIHEQGHPEPWIIAMNDIPSDYKVLDYGMRWGIEPMFSDFKSRGFCLTNTHLIHPERIERLILILAIAMYWAVSAGMHATDPPPKIPKKNTTEALHPSSKQASASS